MTDINAEPLAPESLKMIKYLRTRAAETTAAAIRDRLRAAAQELESVIAAVDPSTVRLRPIEGKWTIAGVSTTSLRLRFAQPRNFATCYPAIVLHYHPCTKLCDPARPIGHRGTNWSKGYTTQTDRLSSCSGRHPKVRRRTAHRR